MEGRKLPFTIHICRIHTRKFLFAKFEKVYKAARVWNHVSEYLQKWTYRFVAAKRMLEVCKLVEEIFIVSGSTKYTEEVKEILQDPSSFDGRS